MAWCVCVRGRVSNMFVCSTIRVTSPFVETREQQNQRGYGERAFGLPGSCWPIFTNRIIRSRQNAGEKKRDLKKSVVWCVVYKDRIKIDWNDELVFRFVYGCCCRCRCSCAQTMRNQFSNLICLVFKIDWTCECICSNDDTSTTYEYSNCINLYNTCWIYYFQIMYEANLISIEM